MKNAKTIKRVFVLTLVAVMGLSVFAGCGKKTGKGNSGSDITITIGMPKNSNVEDYDTNSYTKWLEEKTGYDLEFVYFSSAQADYSSQVATMVASGEKLPDLLWGMKLEEEAYEMYGQDGFLVDLAPYFEDEEKSANFWDRLSYVYPEDFQEYCRQTLYDTEDGEIYGYPTIESSEFDVQNHMVFINQAWLDKLGLAMPTDTNSLYNVLKAFVTKDPNGNGQKDEVGIVCTDGVTGSYGGITWITNMFINESRNYWWNVDENGQLYSPYIQDEYRQALIYIRKLIDDGLMPESVFTMNQASIKGIANSTDGINKAGIIVAHPTLAFMENNEALYEYTAMKHFGYVVNTGGSIYKNCFITTDAENPDEVWNLLMTMTTEESAFRQRYGEKGVDWVEADEGAKSFIGKEAKVKILNDSAWATGNTLWHYISGTINIDSEQESRQVDENNNEWSKWKLDLMKKEYENFKAAEDAKPSVLAPTLVMTQDEKEATQSIRDNCKAWISSMRAKFACGTDDLDPNKDSDWNAYVNKLKSFGIEEWEEQSQKIYERQIAE